MNAIRVPMTVCRVGIAIAVLCGAAYLPAAHSQSLTRGPYLQMGTPTTQVVRWRTDVATDSRVRLGASPGALTTSVDVGTLATEHAIGLTGLAPNTVYYYSVGSTASQLAGGDANHYFITSPSAGAAEPMRVWVLGDAGTAGPTGINANQTAVRNAYSTFSGGQYTDLILMLGDNAYNDGTDAEYQNAVFNMYGSFLRQSNLWSTIGNHDTAQSTNPNVATLPYFNIFTLPAAGEAGGLASGTEKYYSFDFGNIHFVCLDSMTTNRAVDGAMLTWLASDLAANTKPWIIAFWHHPPYSKGSHNSDTETPLIEMRQNALPILESYGVDLVLSGHSHSYERSKLIGGHYGPSTTLSADMIKDGGSGRPSESGAYTKPTDPYRAVYAVAGSSGQTSGGTLNHPVMYISLNNLGSMVLDVSGDRLDAKFLRENATVADSFTILKTAENAPPTVSMTSPGNGATFAAPANVALAATASDPDGTVARVEFYNGTTLLGSDTSAPYAFAWNGVPVGSYVLTAKAVDNGGATATSAAVGITIVSTAPAAPSALVATAVSSSQITLTWTDNANNESGFKIERSTNGVTYTQIATVGANVTTYADTGLARNKTYRYRVRATGTGGDSAYTNVATAKTLRK
jgi:predicted MPP superfamily phosphohydrolase